MTNLRQVAQQALEALEYASTGNRRPEIIGPAITALRKALEQPEQEQQIETLKRCLFQMQEAAKNLVEQEKSLTPPAAQPEPTCPECKAAVLYECVACSSNNYPPAAQPEPMPWRESASDYERGVIDGMQKQAQSSVDKAVNAMTQRTWVGLTPEEMKHLYPYGRSVWGKETYEAIEKALKDKNDH